MDYTQLVKSLKNIVKKCRFREELDIAIKNVRALISACSVKNKKDMNLLNGLREILNLIREKDAKGLKYFSGEELMEFVQQRDKSVKRKAKRESRSKINELEKELERIQALSA